MKKMLCLCAGLMLSLGASITVAAEVVEPAVIMNVAPVDVAADEVVDVAKDIAEIKALLGSSYYRMPTVNGGYYCTADGKGGWNCVKVIALGVEEPRPDK